MGHFSASLIQFHNLMFLPLPRKGTLIVFQLTVDSTVEAILGEYQEELMVFQSSTNPQEVHLSIYA